MKGLFIAVKSVEIQGEGQPSPLVRVDLQLSTLVDPVKTYNANTQKDSAAAGPRKAEGGPPTVQGGNQAAQHTGTIAGPPT